VSTIEHLAWENVTEGMDACYREDDHELYIRFASGNVWKFEGVPRTFYTKMCAAADPRRNFRAHILGRFNYERLEA